MVIIKDMEMPRNCGLCKLQARLDDDYWHCMAGGFYIKPSEMDLRDGLCPLFEMPEMYRNKIDAFNKDEEHTGCTSDACPIEGVDQD